MIFLIIPIIFPNHRDNNHKKKLNTLFLKKPIIDTIKTKAKTLTFNLEKNKQTLPHYITPTNYPHRIPYPPVYPEKLE